MTQNYSSTTDKRRQGMSGESLMDKASDAAQSVADQGRYVAKKVQESSEDAYNSVERSVRDQPMAAIALAAVLGFAVGALWKIGSSRDTWWDRMGSNYYEPAMRQWRQGSWWR